MHACDRRTDRQTDGHNYDSQDRPRICSRGKKLGWISFKAGKSGDRSQCSCKWQYDQHCITPNRGLYIDLHCSNAVNGMVGLWNGIPYRHFFGRLQTIRFFSEKCHTDMSQGHYGLQCIADWSEIFCNSAIRVSVIFNSECTGNHRSLKLRLQKFFNKNIIKTRFNIFILLTFLFNFQLVKIARITFPDSSNIDNAYINY